MISRDWFLRTAWFLHTLLAEISEHHYLQQNNPKLKLYLMPPINTFVYFPNLPRELQQVIWSFGCREEPRGELRIYCISPYPVNYNRIVFESIGVQFSIIHQHLYAGMPPDRDILQ
jgi:hypothetical protein